MGEKEAVLLERAEGEEKAYNWGEAAKLYEQVTESFLDKKMREEAAEIYYKIGFAYYRLADTVETADQYTEAIKKSVKALKEAGDLYTESQNRAKILECEAFALAISSSIMRSVSEVKSKLNRAHEFFIEASELYLKMKDQESYLRILNRASFFLVMYILLCSDPKEMDEYYEKGVNLGFKAWSLSKEIKNTQYLAEALMYDVALYANSFTHKIIRQYTIEEHGRELLLRCEDSLRLLEGCDDSRILGMIFLSVGVINLVFGFYFIEDEVKQNKYSNKGIEYMEKGVEFLKKTRDKSHIIFSLFLLIFLSVGAGKINYLQKRIINDLNDLLELGKIYRNSTLSFYFHSIYLPAFYYANIAQWSFFTSTQRKSYAEKAIGYAQESIKKLVFPPYLTFSYLALTMSHSVLVYLGTDKNKKEDHLKKMLQYAQQAKEIGENFPGGFPRSFGYNALSRAYKTLADNTESEEERIKMLTIAADASKKYIEYALGGTGIFSAQIRLGLLYEEIGIISMNKDTLMTAKELFLQLIEQCQKRGYHSYAAAAYEYIARIEDRLGNYNVSAQYYENAQNAYAETLKHIEYKLLKNRVNEKMNYATAWNLIENAKAYHKKESHIKAQETYKKASEILKNLASFKYEAHYYSAWAFQEEAEQLSKKEEHNKAVEQYELSERTFIDAINTMEKISNRSKNKFMVERIEKLMQVANLRIKYCSARANVEKARIMGKRGEHSAAAELFASAASQFKYVCNFFKIKRERNELEAVYYLCRAWECMEFAELYEEPERFSEAANLFIKASNLFSDSKLKFLASGNSTFCQALQLGCKFDEVNESELKAELYPKIKVLLRKAASTYEKGNFENGSNWALATSTYFDAAWHLIRADEELNLDEKSRLLEVGYGLLKSTAELFSNAGYKDKEREVLKGLNMVEKEEKIIFSALNSIRKPDISSSTIGIIAPTCSLETSQSPRLGEIQQISEESRRVKEKKLEDSPKLYECDKFLNIIHLSDIQEGRFGIKEDISSGNEAYYNYLSDLESKLEIIHRKNKIDFIVISGDLASTGSKEEYDNLTKEFIPILNKTFLEGINIVPKHRWIIIPGNHDVEWDKADARFNNFIQFCQENGFHQYKLNEPEAIYSDIVCKEITTGNTFGILGLNSCLDILDETSRNESNISKAYFSGFSKNWDNSFREMAKLMVCHHTLHSIKGDKFDHALNALRDNNMLLSLAGDIHKSDSTADEISKIRCIPAGTISAKKSEREYGIDAVSRQFNLINLNLKSGYVKWYTYLFEGTWREIKNESFYLEHTTFSKKV